MAVRKKKAAVKPVWEQEIIAEAEAKRERRGVRSNAKNAAAPVIQDQDPRARQRRALNRAKRLMRRRDVSANEAIVRKDAKKSLNRVENRLRQRQAMREIVVNNVETGEEVKITTHHQGESDKPA
jgi:hypothetical protein